MKNIYAIVLAAGKGTRMKSEALPKVLFPIAGKPMIEYVLKSLKEIGIDQPILVVGFLASLVKETFGGGYHYVTQEEQLGTAHAVSMAKPLLEGKSGCTLIINGDQPFFKPATLKRLAAAVTEKGATVAVLTGNMDDSEFDAFGRVITDNEGFVQSIIEKKDATEDELKVRLMNLGGYAVDNTWLWQVIEHIKKSPVTGEYYVTDLVAEAVKQGKKVTSIEIETKAEAIGINTLDHLAEAERLIVLEVE